MSFSPYIRLYSGRKFHFLRPTVAEIDIDDIAHNLSHICRFTGACKKFYSVAEHAVHCAAMASEELKLEALMHDASEYTCQDVNSPMKSLLPQYKEIESRVERAIARKFNLPYPHNAGIKQIDLRMLVTEMAQLLPGDDARLIPFEPYNIKLPCWNSARAKQEFLKAFKRYTR